MDSRTTHRVLIALGIAALAAAMLGLYACHTRALRRRVAVHLPASWMPAIERTTCAIDRATPGAESLTRRICAPTSPASHPAPP